MGPEDLDAVMAVQRAAYAPPYHESGEVLAAKQVLGGALCQVAEDAGSCVGYVLAHPWSLAQLPPLHRVCAAPPAPDGVFLHDLALAPAARGTGLGQRLLAAVEAAVAGRFERIGLISLPAALGFWHRHGFVAEPAADPAACGYGIGARYLTRTVLSA